MPRLKLNPNGSAQGLKFRTGLIKTIAPQQSPRTRKGTEKMDAPLPSERMDASPSERMGASDLPVFESKGERITSVNQPGRPEGMVLPWLMTMPCPSEDININIGARGDEKPETAQR